MLSRSDQEENCILVVSQCQICYINFVDVNLCLVNLGEEELRPTWYVKLILTI